MKMRLGVVLVLASLLVAPGENALGQTLGSPDFQPTVQRPVGWRGADGKILAASGLPSFCTPILQGGEVFNIDSWHEGTANKFSAARLPAAEGGKFKVRYATDTDFAAEIGPTSGANTLGWSKMVLASPLYLDGLVYFVPVLHRGRIAFQYVHGPSEHLLWTNCSA